MEQTDIQLEIEVDAIAGVLVVAARGDVVAGAVGKVHELLDQGVTDGRPVVIDLVAVGALDAAGVHLLLDVHRRLGTCLLVVAERGGVVHLGLKDAGIAHALHRSLATALAASSPLAASPTNRT